MKRITVNICYQKSGNEYYVYKGTCVYAFGTIYDKLFFNILTDEQKMYIEDNKYSKSFTTNTLRLSIPQFIVLVEKVKPIFRQIRFYEDVIITAFKFNQKLKQKS